MKTVLKLASKNPDILKFIPPIKGAASGSAGSGSAGGTSASDKPVVTHTTTLSDYTSPSLALVSSGNDSPIVMDASGTEANVFGNGTVSRYGVKVTDTTLRNKYLAQNKFWILRNNNPTGTLIFTIRKTSDDSIVLTADTSIDVSTIGTTYTEITVNWPSGLTPNEDYYILSEYSGGDGTNYLMQRSQTAGAWAGGHETQYDGTYADSTGKDVRGELIFGGGHNAVDESTGTNWASVSEVNPNIYADMLSTLNLCACQIRPEASTTATEITIQSSPDASVWTTVRTITYSNLTEGVDNFIRFNPVSARYLRIRATDGGAVILSITEFYVFTRTDGELASDHEHQTISPTDTSLGLDGT